MGVGGKGLVGGKCNLMNKGGDKRMSGEGIGKNGLEVVIRKRLDSMFSGWEGYKIVEYFKGNLDELLYGATWEISSPSRPSSWAKTEAAMSDADLDAKVRADREHSTGEYDYE
jgi:hypothetical protein